MLFCHPWQLSQNLNNQLFSFSSFPLSRSLKINAEKKFGTSQYGFLVEASAITEDMLSDYTKSEIERIARLQTPREERARVVVDKYYESLKKNRRLHLRNEHSRWVTITLDHLRFLVSIGAKILGVAHVVLFASLTPESQRLHPYRARIESLLRRREDVQREAAGIKRLVFPTKEQLNRGSFLKCLAFLTKIRYVSSASVIKPSLADSFLLLIPPFPLLSSLPCEATRRAGALRPPCGSSSAWPWSSSSAKLGVICGGVNE